MEHLLISINEMSELRATIYHWTASEIYQWINDKSVWNSLNHWVPESLSSFHGSGSLNSLFQRIHSRDRPGSARMRRMALGWLGWPFLLLHELFWESLTALKTVVFRGPANSCWGLPLEIPSFWSTSQKTAQGSSQNSCQNISRLIRFQLLTITNSVTGSQLRCGPNRTRYCAFTPFADR